MRNDVLEYSRTIRTQILYWGYRGYDGMTQSTKSWLMTRRNAIWCNGVQYNSTDSLHSTCRFTWRNFTWLYCSRCQVGGLEIGRTSRPIGRHPLDLYDIYMLITLHYATTTTRQTAKQTDTTKLNTPGMVAIRECNNFASSWMSQNRSQWNLDFRFPSSQPFFLDRIILLYIIDNEHKLAPHLFEQH